jgi:hypothetical protein
MQGPNKTVTVNDAGQGLLNTDTAHIGVANAARLHSVTAFNGTAGDLYLHVEDTSFTGLANVGEMPVGAYVAHMVIKVPAGANASLDYGMAGRPLKSGGFYALLSTSPSAVANINPGDSNSKLEATYYV